MNSTKTTAKDKAKTAVIIVAAGEGTRLGGAIPKAYHPLAAKPILAHSIEIFQEYPLVDAVLVMHHPAHLEWVAPLQKTYPAVIWAEGGATRQESVKLGLETLKNYGFEYVLIHDAARPYADVALITRVMEALKSGAKAVLPAISVKDTIKQVADGYVINTPERRSLYAAQTPQGFAFDCILQLHHESTAEITDDAMLAERAGIPVQMVAGDAKNLKITTKEDMPPQFRIGQGFDVHAFSTEGAKGFITLCGTKVPCDANLVGHSDGDVGIHALVDAILGALALGDIGQHFPPSDMRWKDANSSIFLQHACQLMAERTAMLVNADITIISEKPKVSPHRVAMQQRLAEIMGVSPHIISVKATTTEKLGFTGREEGIAAQAVVMLQI